VLISWRGKLLAQQKQSINCRESSSGILCDDRVLGPENRFLAVRQLVSPKSSCLPVGVYDIGRLESLYSYNVAWNVYAQMDEGAAGYMYDQSKLPSSSESVVN